MPKKRKASTLAPNAPPRKEAKHKAKRPDRAAKKLLNKETSFSTVKATLNSFCQEPYFTDGIKDVLETILKEVNKTIAEAYVLANIHVTRLCLEARPVPQLTHQFYYACLSAVSQGAKARKAIEDVELAASVELYDSWKPDGYSKPDSRNLSSGWHQNASMQMETNTQNSVSAAFYGRFRRYLKARYDMDGRQAYKALKDINAEAYDGPDEVVLRYRDMMPPRAVRLLEKAPHLMMPLQYKFLTFLEAKLSSTTTDEQKKGLKLFSLLPTKNGFTCSHLKICANSLSGLLRRAGVQFLPSDGKDFREAAPDIWRYYFHIDKYETDNRKFAGEILTDGKAVSILMRKPKVAAPEARVPKLEDFDERWGLDPGRRDLFCATNEQGSTISWSTRQFYEEAKYKYTAKKVKLWQTQEPVVLEAVRNMPSKKTADLGAWKLYVQFMLPRLDMLVSWSMRRKLRDLKFTRYVMAHRKLDEICYELTARAGSRTLVGFGDWSNRDQAGIIKRAPAGPVKRLEHRLKQYATVVPIDEFRTSKLHHKCLQQTHNQHSIKRCKGTVRRRGRWRDGEDQTVKVHGVLFCRNRSCNGMTMNRDVNASRNILVLLERMAEGRPRPQPLSRSLLPSGAG